eukprot:gene10563-12496_t
MFDIIPSISSPPVDNAPSSAYGRLKRKHHPGEGGVDTTMEETYLFPNDFEDVEEGNQSQFSDPAMWLNLLASQTSGSGTDFDSNAEFMDVHLELPPDVDYEDVSDEDLEHFTREILPEIFDVHEEGDGHEEAYLRVAQLLSQALRMELAPPSTHRAYDFETLTYATTRTHGRFVPWTPAPSDMRVTDEEDLAQVAWYTDRAGFCNAARQLLLRASITANLHTLHLKN